jgi:hypothetical protein
MTDPTESETFFDWPGRGHFAPGERYLHTESGRPVEYIGWPTWPSSGTARSSESRPSETATIGQYASIVAEARPDLLELIERARPCAINLGGDCDIAAAISLSRAGLQAQSLVITLRSADEDTPSNQHYLGLTAGRDFRPCPTDCGGSRGARCRDRRIGRRRLWCATGRFGHAEPDVPLAGAAGQPGAVRNGERPQPLGAVPVAPFGA